MIAILLLAKSIIVVSKAYIMCIYSKLSFTTYCIAVVIIFYVSYVVLKKQKEYFGLNIMSLWYNTLRLANFLVLLRYG